MILEIETRGKGLYEITDQIRSGAGELPLKGLLNCFVQHTSCSLLIQENADPSARQDLESFYARLAPDGESWHQHTYEGPDDTTSHMRSSLGQVSLNIPVIDGRLALGTWQGIFLFEHRIANHRRRIILTSVPI